MINPKPGSYEYSQQFVNPMRRWTTICKSPTGEDIQIDTFDELKKTTLKIFKGKPEPKMKITRALVVDAESTWVKE